jgi:hypothetical protein
MAPAYYFTVTEYSEVRLLQLQHACSPWSLHTQVQLQVYQVSPSDWVKVSIRNGLDSYESSYATLSLSISPARVLCYRISSV